MILESSCSLLPLWNLFLGKAPFFSNMRQINVPVFSHLLLFYLLLFLAVLGLCCFVWAFSSCGEQGLFAWASPCRSVSCWGAQALGCLGFSSHSSQARLLCSMWDLPGPGIEPVSPTLGGGLLSTAPPGKSFFQEVFASTNFLLSSSRHLRPTSYSGFSYRLLLILTCTEVTHWRLQAPNSWLPTWNVPIFSPLLKWSRTLWSLACLSSACLLCVKKL